MKRYTLKVQCLEDSVTPANFKVALEKLLLRAQPPLTFHLGMISQPEAGVLLAEIASEAKKDSLEARLKALESRLPIKIEKLGWGWIAGKEPQPVPDLTPVTFQVGMRFALARYLFMLCLVMALIGGVVLWALKNRLGPFPLLAFEWIFLTVYLIFLSLLNNTPLNFRLVPKQIDCLADELVVTYQFRKEPVRLKWDEITGLETKVRVFIIQTKQKPVRFFMPYPSSPKNTDALRWDALIQAIAQRANLNNVEGGISLVMYKRFEVP